MAKLSIDGTVVSRVANRVLDEFVYRGKNLRQWISIVVSDADTKTFGHWEHGYYGALHCSECDPNHLLHGISIPYDFCPNCGMPMKPPSEQAED